MEGTEVIHQVELSRIVDSPFQVRRTYGEGDLNELAASVRVVGVQQPAIGREVGGVVELVVGHRRRRAATLASLSTLPVIIRALSDELAQEIVLIENLQRVDVHPLDEAESIAKLLEVPGHTIQSVADKLGKARAYVVQRLTLNQLCADAAKAFRAGRLTAYGAFSVARLQTPELQQAAVKELCSLEDPAGNHRVRRVVEAYLLTLDSAPFDTQCATLLPAAGACLTCPKRSGSNADLFGDMSRKDLCWDKSCYAAKTAATWTLLCEEALSQGHEVLDEEASALLFPHNGSFLARSSGYLDLAAPCEADERRRSWKSVLGRKCPPVTLARDGLGRPRRLVKLGDAKQLLQQKQAREGSPSGNIETAPAKVVDTRRETVAAGLAAIVAAAESAPVGEDVIRFIARGLLESSWTEVRRAVAKRRGLATKEQPDGGLEYLIDAMSVAEAQALCVELVATKFAVPAHLPTGFGGNYLKACSLLGVSLPEGLETAAPSPRADVSASEGNATTDPEEGAGEEAMETLNDSARAA
jgi:ParB/RepB/Spo0J family partition protein